jgi:hypothetical protein
VDMVEIVAEAWTDTCGLLPLLAAVYVAVGYMEYRCGDRMGTVLGRLGGWGPLAGAFLGCVPQCGFSVIAAAFYVKRFISAGTLLAVFISTSDEALPVLLSMPGQVVVVELLVAVKIVIAVMAGLGLDLALGLCRSARTATGLSPETSVVPPLQEGCCAHGVCGARSRLEHLVFHPLRHTAGIFLFLFGMSVLMGSVMSIVGEAGLRGLVMNGTVYQPLITAFIGFIPSCFASVFLAQLFAGGIISFGALVAGSCAGAGLGILVLFRQSRDLKDTLMLTGILLLVSMTAGIVIQFAGALK